MKPCHYQESNANGILSVKRAPLDPESRAAILKRKRQQFERALDEQVGFRKVIDCITETQNRQLDTIAGSISFTLPEIH